MAPANSESLQVRVDTLPAVYDALVDALKGGGLTAAELTDTFAEHVTAECLQCGLQVRGEELGRLGCAPAETPGADEGRLGRLRQGYCGRKDCNSYYYRIDFKEHPKIDWRKVVAGLGNVQAPTPAAAPPAGTRVALILPLLQDRRVVRVAIGVAILVLLLIVKHFATGGRIPLLHKSPKYTVDPASVTEEPRGPNPSRTNQVPRR